MKRLWLCGLVAGLLLAGCGAGSETDAPADSDSEATTSQAAPEDGASDSATVQNWSSETSEMGAVKIGEMAPDFEVQDENGETWKLSDYQGQVVLLDFWALW